MARRRGVTKWGRACKGDTARFAAVLFGKQFEGRTGVRGAQLGKMAPTVFSDNSAIRLGQPFPIPIYPCLDEQRQAQALHVFFTEQFKGGQGFRMLRAFCVGFLKGFMDASLKNIKQTARVICLCSLSNLCLSILPAHPGRVIPCPPVPRPRCFILRTRARCGFTTALPGAARTTG